ncbi:hypothetical protein ACFFVB_05430 [Formosa undariae]|uniref:DUF2116 family Zn-ribbon domain-containing protein n=1 Tax=Formosa undariae TaxID=1325436 RepID=A0ABV5EZB2_9FLAO
MEVNKCKACGEVLLGRSDKRFCDMHCKSSFHYKKSITEAPRFYNKVDNQLKNNRRILKNYNKSGKAIIRKDQLISEGFNPNYFTHYWKNTKGDVYLFIYEYGFLRKTEHDVEKYILIMWQDYMEK